MLQLVMAKFRHHPLSFASCPKLQIGGKRPPRQGSRSRAVGDGRNHAPIWFSRCDFQRYTQRYTQRDGHTHYPTTVTCSENRPKAGKKNCVRAIGPLRIVATRKPSENVSERRTYHTSNIFKAQPERLKNKKVRAILQGKFFVDTHGTQLASLALLA